MKYVWLLLVACGLQAQVQVSGRVVESGTLEPLSFANLHLSDHRNFMTDLDGRFAFTAQPGDKLVCSYTGFDPLTVNDLSQNMTIVLTRQTAQLEPVAVSRANNPAMRIIRKTMANKPLNDPRKLRSYQFRCYSKVTADFLFGKNERDSIQVSQVLGNGHIFLTESVTQRRFLAPNYSHDQVLSTRISGMKNPPLAALATDFQPFSFYEDYFKLMDTRFLNPLAKGSLARYTYRLEDENIVGKDTVFTISFRPRKGTTFDGLNGRLYINSNGYAIQQVIARPAESGKTDVWIRQQYRWVDGHWFPEQLGSIVVVNDYPKPGMGLYLESKSYLSDVQFDLPLTKADFPIEAVTLPPQAARDTVLLAQQRIAPLSSADVHTYRVIDSLGNAFKFDRKLAIAQKLMQKRIPIGPLDIDLANSFKINRYESLRVGIGLVTNEKIARHYALGGYAGYGIKDRAWKYGASLGYDRFAEIGFGWKIEASDDLREIGQNPWQQTQIFALRPLIGSRYDNIRKATATLRFRNFRNLYWNASFTVAQVVPKYLYAAANGNLNNAYRMNTVDLSVRIPFGIISSSPFDALVQTQPGNPLVEFYASKGIDAFDGDFEALKLQLAVAQELPLRHLGLFRYRIEAGYLDKFAPLGMRFTGAGSCVNDFPFWMPNGFQTMQPYEFVSDRFASAFLTHRFGKLLLRSNWFQPDIALYQNMGWGAQHWTSTETTLPYATMEHGYLESGISLDDVVRVNYGNLGYLGLGVAGFYRYGANRLPHSSDNLAFKIGLKFSAR